MPGPGAQLLRALFPSASRCREPAFQPVVHLAVPTPDAHSWIVQRSVARTLVVLLVMLALAAGGGRFAAMAMSLDEAGAQMGDMQQPDMTCKACGGAVTSAPCDAVCVASPATGVAALGLSYVGLHERWMIRSESGAAHSIRPDTSPPRA